MEKYCIYQDRCHQEVEQKLISLGIIPEARDLIILHLIQENFLNEERFAKSFVSGKYKIKLWGRFKIEQGLKQKGVSKFNIERGLKEIDLEVYTQNLENLARSKRMQIKEGDFFKIRQKLHNFLWQRGFEKELIEDVLLEIFSAEK